MAKRGGRPMRRELKTQVPLPSGAPVTAGPSWRVQETLRFWCPLCGMVADVERLAQSPYPVKIKLQRYGGSFTGGIGYMEYVDVDDVHRINLVRELAKKAELLPLHLATELEAAPTAPETFAEWVNEARKRWPGLATDYDLVLHGLSLALRDAGVDVAPDELSERFHHALAPLSPTVSFRDLVYAMTEVLERRVAQLPYLSLLDDRIVSMTLSSLSHLQVPATVEQEAKKAVQEHKLRRGTAKYRNFVRENAAAWIAAERENFEAAKARALAEVERKRQEWKDQAERALALAELLEKDLDIVTGVYTLAGMRVPEELLAEVASAVERLGQAGRAMERLQTVREWIEARTFEEHMEKYQQPILKEAWEWLKSK